MIVSDPRVNELFAENVARLLAERNLNVHWLKELLDENANRIYPACRGETNVSLELAARIARALKVSLDELVPLRKLTHPAKAQRAGKRLNRILEKSA